MTPSKLHTQLRIVSGVSCAFRNGHSTTTLDWWLRKYIHPRIDNLILAQHAFLGVDRHVITIELDNISSLNEFIKVAQVLIRLRGID